MYDGPAFSEAVRSYARGLDAEDQDALADVLLERAGGPEVAIRERWAERGWFRRMLRRMSGGR